MDRDFLFGVIAVQLGQATPAQVMTAASAYFADRSKSIPERLLSDGVLTEDRFRMIRDVVATMVQAHDGDVARAVASVGGQQAVFASFGGSVVVDAKGDVGPASSQPGAADAAIEDVAAVQAEAPGRYRVGSEVGRGGIGRVLVAFDTHLGREIAVKELLGGTGSVPSTPRSDGPTRTRAEVARFLREARVTGQLEHPNIVPVYEVGRRPDGTLYYTMKLVRGRTLSRALRDCATLQDRLRLLPHYVDLCNAVAYAHSRGVVHRDLKTDNVMLGEFGETVVLDWGLARVHGQKDVRGGEIAREISLLQDAAAGHTVDGSAIGTPAYMSPEQAEGLVDAIDERSDVWSLGAVLFEILTGRPPFQGVTPYEIIGKVLKDEVPAAKAVLQDVPAELSAVAAKALTRDKAGRYARAGDLAAEVRAFMTGGRIAAYEYGSWELIRRFVARNKALTAGIAAVVTISVAATILIVFAYGRERVARDRAEAQERAASANLAQAFLNRAEDHNRERNFGAAHLYAAAALREFRRDGRAVPEDRRAALDSAMYAAEIGRSLELERTLPGTGGVPMATAISHDGRLLAVVDAQQEIRIVPLDGSGPGTHRTTPTYLFALAFTKDDTEVVAGCMDGLRRLDVADLAERAHHPMGWPVWIHPDDPNVVLETDGTKLRLVRVDGSQPPVDLGPFAGAGYTTAGDLLVRCTADGRIALHDGRTGAVRDTFPFADHSLFACSPDADGRRLLSMGGNDGVVAIDVARRQVAARLGLGTFLLASAVPSPDGPGWLVGTDGRAFRWEGRGAGIDEVLWAGGQRTLVAVSPDGTRVVTAEKGAVRVWRIRPSGRVLRLPIDRDAMSASFSPDGRHVVFASLNGTVYVAGMEPGDAPRVIARHDAVPCTDTAFSPDGRLVATAGHDPWVRLIDPATGDEVAARELTRVEWPSDRCASVRWAPDGRRLAVTAPDGRVHVLDARTLALERILAANLPWPRALRFSRDGRLLVAGAHWGMLAAWDTDTWEIVSAGYDDAAGDLSDLVVTPDNAFAITAGVDGFLRRYDIRQGRYVAGVRAHDAWVNEVALSPDGTTLLTGSDDARLRIWNAADFALLRTVDAGIQVAGIAFAPDGKRFSSGSLGALAIYPHLPPLWDQDGAARFEAASAVSGYALDGFALQARDLGRETPAAEVREAEAPVVPAPDEIRGHVEEWFYPDKGLAADAEVELVDLEHRPFAPPIVMRPARDRRVATRLPDGVERFAARVTVGGETSWCEEANYRRGAGDLVFRKVGALDVALLIEKVGLKPAPGTGHLVGAVVWGDPAERRLMQPVGCVEAIASGGTRIWFGAPSASSRVNPDPRLTSLHPGSPFLYAFNLAPGTHRVALRAGGEIVERTVVIHPDAVTKVSFVFPKDRFPQNPTPPKCHADWPPPDEATAPAAQGAAD